MRAMYQSAHGAWQRPEHGSKMMEMLGECPQSRRRQTDEMRCACHDRDLVGHLPPRPAVVSLPQMRRIALG